MADEIVVNADNVHTEESKSIFNEAMKAVAAEEQAEITQPLETKVALVTEKKDPPATEEKSAFPDEFITGDKKVDAVKEDALQQLEAMELPKNAKPEQVASFKQLKEQSKKIIEEKLARITELETKTEGTADKSELDAAAERIKTFEAKIREQEEQLERADFTNSPKFKAQFVASEQSAIEGAKAYLVGTEINPNVIELAMKESGPKRLAILREAGADAETIAAISPHLANYDAIQRGKTEALENWKANSTQWQQEQKAQQEKQETARKVEETRVFDTVMKSVEMELLPYRKASSDDKWNAQGNELRETARRISIGESSTEEIFRVVAAGVAAPVMQKVIDDLSIKYKTVLAENAKLKAAKPSGGSGLPPKINGDNGNTSPEEISKGIFNRELAIARGE